MLEDLNDYLSFFVMIIILIISLKLLISINFDNRKFEKEKISILYDYENNEDE